jgi:hypothetical protein
MKIEQLLNDNELEQLIYEGDISKINQVFKANRPNRREEICRQFEDKLLRLIDRYNGDEISKIDYNQYFEYLYCYGDYNCIRMVIERILTVDGVTALRRFSSTADLDINPERFSISKNIKRSELKNHIMFSNKKTLISDADERFLESLGISDFHDMSKQEVEIETTRQKRGLGRGKDTDDAEKDKGISIKRGSMTEEDSEHNKKGTSKRETESEDKELGKKSKFLGLFNKL